MATQSDKALLKIKLKLLQLKKKREKEVVVATKYFILNRTK